MRSRPILAVTAALGLAACAGQPGPDGSSSTSATMTAPTTVSLTTASPAPLDWSGRTPIVVTDSVAVPRGVVALDSTRQLIAGQEGLVIVLEDGARRPRPFLDLTDEVLGPGARSIELGMTGFALAPEFATSGTFYTFATMPPPDDAPSGTLRIDTLSRWRANPTTLVADPESRRDLITLPRSSVDHVAGEIVLAPDGLLYTAFGAPSGDAVAQDPGALEGKVVRIDPRSRVAGRSYGIPDDNPFARGGGRPEIYSVGYRNPWRMAWSKRLGLIVGSAMWVDKDQQVDRPRPGDNAGYPEVRGACWAGGQVAAGCRTTTAGAHIAPPVFEYAAGTGQILSGVAPLEAGPFAGQILVSNWLGTLLAAQPGTPPWSAREITLPRSVIGPNRYLWDLQAASDGSVLALVSLTTMDSGWVYRIDP